MDKRFASGVSSRPSCVSVPKPGRLRRPACGSLVSDLATIIGVQPSQARRMSLLDCRFIPFAFARCPSVRAFIEPRRPTTTPSADSQPSFQRLHSACSPAPARRSIGPPGIRLRASPQATPNLPRRSPHEFWASESIAPLPDRSRPSIRFLSIVSVVLPPASFPWVLTPQLPLARSSAHLVYRGLQPHRC